MGDTKVIFLPGNGGGTTHDNWFPYVKRELVRLGVRVIAQDFPDAALARSKHWLPFIKHLGADQATILIGHSSGGVAAMRYAEKNRILGSVLVGVNYTDLGIREEKLSGYYDASWDWAAIKSHQQWIILFASTDDPFIPIAEPRHISNQLQPEYHEFTNQGHFGHGAQPKLEFSELVNVVKLKLV